MTQDKAIIKALKSIDNPGLSADFNSRLMNSVCLAVEKKNRRSQILSLCLLSSVSLGLIGMAVYLLKDHFSWDFTLRLQTFQLPSESIANYAFGFYIAFLIFILIGLDNFFRHMLHKRKEHKINPFN